MDWGDFNRFVNFSEPELACIPNVLVTNETKMALLVFVKGESCWISRSQIQTGTEISTVGDVGDLCIPEWLAEKKGLI